MVGCAASLLIVGVGATTYVKVGGHLKLVSSSSVSTVATSSAAAKTSATPSPSKETVSPSSAPASTLSSSPSPSSASSSSDSDSISVSDPLEGEAFSGVPQVGTLFGTSDGSLTSHHCTGSVVSSPQGDIVVTAAHCAYSSSGVRTDLAFVPDFDDGSMPYGVWDVSAVYVAQQWISDRDPDYDVAFIVVHKSGSSTPIQDVVGADTLAVDQSYTALTTVIGYPSDTDEPITCTNRTSEFSSTQLQWDCDGYPGGTSGSPFLTDVNSKTGLGTVDGVIGGYETGGDSPDVSYSVRFTAWVSQLLADAESKN